MRGRHFAWMSVAVVTFLVLVPGAVFAQSGFAGVVRDTSGAVLPGVTVEAASPVLIEKVRTAVTDGEGRYSIVDLRPGAYTVTFSLGGFNTVRREGLELPPAFTANVSVEMTVGAMEETITVSGTAPLVDVQNATSQRVLSAELMDALPSSRSPQGLAGLMPGVTAQGLGTIVGAKNQMITATHGAPAGESVYMLDGMNMASVSGPGGAGLNMRMPQTYIAEMNVVTGGGTADQQLSGTITNVIPKEGGNSFSGSVYAAYSNSNLAWSNLTPELAAQGFTKNSVANLIKLWDIQPAVGGRLVRDKLWFFVSCRCGPDSGSILSRPGFYDNLTPRGWAYTPDVNRPAVAKLTTGSKNGRFTWQVSPKNKVSIFADWQPIDNYGAGLPENSPISPEAAAMNIYRPNNYKTVKWTSPVTNRLLLEVGGFDSSTDNNRRRQTTENCFCSAPDVGFDVVAKVDNTNGILFGSAADQLGGSAYVHQSRHSMRYNATASYVTGTHSLKVGMSWTTGSFYWDRQVNGDQIYFLRDGRPQSITLYPPHRYEDHLRPDLGVFVSDSWTRDRLTLTGGVRWDYFNNRAQPITLPANWLVPERSFPGTNHSPQWSDISPRVGTAFDLFGDGRTAIKASVGRFVQGFGINPRANHPVQLSVLTVTRTWTDANNDFSPGCDLANPLANGECGQISNLNFGRNNPNAGRVAPELLTGLRPHNWEATVQVQREIITGVSVTVGYFHKVFKGFTKQDNLRTSPSDFSEYCITSPTHPQLPGGGGERICGLYDVSPALFGQSELLLIPVDNSTGYDGIDILQSVRLAGGVTISGGVNIQRTTSNTCVVTDSPGDLRFCDDAAPFKPNATYVGMVPLPWWGIVASATYRNYPGAPIVATYQARNAEIAPSLGRNLSSGASGTVNIPLIAPNSAFGARQQQVDIRTSKRVRMGATRRLALNVDLFNIFNQNSPEALNPTYGPTWLRPTALQQGRFARLSAQFDF
jgi:hypothetical protein